MTSFMIMAHVDRPVPRGWESNDDCTFCKIIRNEYPSYKVYENDKIVVILDIMPLRPGHMLLIPKAHYSRVSELPEEYASAAGSAISKVANALTYAVDNTGLNVVCNQEYAQAVPHVHYHIIPAPRLHEATPRSVVPDASPGSQEDKAPKTMREMHRMEFESRGCLDDEAARALVRKLQAKL